MKKRGLIIIGILLILILNVLMISSGTENKKIDSYVYESLEENQEVRVVIEVKDNLKESVKEKTKEDIKDKVGEEDVRHVFDKQIAVEISEKELNELNLNPNVKSISIDKPMVALLQDSVPLINATSVWPLQVNGVNITGTDTTVCILDTGINFSHQDLIGRNKTCVIDCVGKSCTPDCSIGDDNGHGTHVAGIVGASGGIKGVAVSVGLIGVKVLNSAGSGSESDIGAGINWCIDNSQTYNISVISISIGTDCDYTPQYCYREYCDSSEPVIAPRIDNATARNISVVIASGNDDNYTRISSPACIKNATAVTSTDKSDLIASYANRNNLTDLAAPGGTSSNGINSTKSTSGYQQRYGTSMATPHVSGVFALIREYYRLQSNRILSVGELENISRITGKQINDTSGNKLNYSRVDVYSAILSVDYIAPIVSLINPLNNNISLSPNYTFSCNASDILLKNITLYVWNSTNKVVYNETKNISGIFNSSEFNVTNLNSDNYKWNCLAFDSKSNSSFASTNFSFNIKNILLSLDYPINSSYTNKNQTFNCSSETVSARFLKNITFYLWNSTNSLIYNKTNNFSGNINSSSFDYNFTYEDSYLWNCIAFNNNSENYSSSSNYSLVYDLTSPNVKIFSPANSVSYSSNSQSIEFTYNASDDKNIANCSLMVNNVVSITNNSIINFSVNHTFSQTFTPATYTWYVSCFDSAGNFNNSDQRAFTVNAVLSNLGCTSCGGGGGGGGGGGSKEPAQSNYSITSQQSSSGYTQQLNKNDRIQFTFFDLNSGEHTLSLGEVSDNSVTLIIRSEPTILMLGIGQSAKLNLTSPDYYDFYVKLNSIDNKKANLTIQTIKEIIPKPTLTGNVVNEDETEKKSEKIFEIQNTIQNLTNEIKKLKTYLYILIPASIIVIIIILLVRIKRKNTKNRKIGEYKETFEKHVKPK